MTDSTSQRPSTIQHGPLATWVQDAIADSATSGYRLLVSGDDAYRARQGSARLALSHICVQTYIWADDHSGRALMSELLRAAKRGVKVYLLLDDMDVRGNDYALALLDQHPLISIRLFNPFKFRWSVFHSTVELFFRGSQLNHRMHNKAWLVDGLYAVVGGRNIGDAYFEQSPDANFTDLDIALAGAEVGVVERSFWEYWNHPFALPIANIKRLRKAAKMWERHPLWQRLHRLPDIRRNVAEEARQQTDEGDLNGRAVMQKGDYHWSEKAQFIADDCRKVSQAAGLKPGVLEALLFRFARVRQELLIVSPYFVPGKAGVALLTQMAARGVTIRILTNSLASNDVLFAHSGYAKRRRTLLSGGVELYELRAERFDQNRAKPPKLRLSSARASLHAKALVIDGEESYVGSFNLDPRSALINTELGVFVDDKDISEQINSLFNENVAAGNSYQVTLKNNRLCWHDGEHTLYREPNSRWWQRLIVRLAQWLPVESQL